MITIGALRRAALSTFRAPARVSNFVYNDYYEQLFSMMSKVVPADVGIDSRVIDDFEGQCAPICVMDVFENDVITIAIFLMKSGVTMPMHDHPGMYGFLRVLHGSADITNYTVKMKRDSVIRPGQTFIGLRHPTIRVTPVHRCYDLRPDNCNIHEISSVSTLVFLDILSPPYVLKQRDPSLSLRPCTFFKEVGKKKEKTPEHLVEVQLEAIKKPDDFYVKQMPYTDPYPDL